MAVKDPDLGHPVHDLIKKRWSPCVFADRPIPEGKLKSLFEAARWAPSSYNEQPWHWVIAFKGTPEFQKILSLLVEPNQEWAKGAPLIGITVTHLTFDRNGKPNRHAYHDVGLAMGGLCVQATAEGLYVHQMAGFDHQGAPKALGIPEGYEAVAAFAIGYAGDPEKASENLKGRDTSKRERRKLADLIHHGTWDKRWLSE
ncbi:MAG: nitroreductase family protein [Parachlamydiales bacterium]